MNPRAASFLVSPFALLATMAVASALDIRTPSAARHDRFTNFPTAPVLNANSWFTGSNYTGVGWAVSDTRRQFALVSPRHFLTASHWGFAASEQVRFLSSTGQLVTATVDSTTVVVRNSQTCDLTLGRFTTTLSAATGVLPLPYLNQSEMLTNGASLEVFGFDAHVGSGIITGFSTEAFSGTTRMYQFNYPPTGDQDDCTFISGDSGAPSFVLVNSKPALTGTHSGVGLDEDTGTLVNFDTYVPYYASQLNTLMANDGYRMIPISPAATPLVVTTTVSPDPLRRMQSGTATFTLQNQSPSAIASNAILSLTFPIGSEPSSVSGSGWFVDVAGPQTWTLHRAKINPNSAAPLTATWTTIPVVASLPVDISHQSDGSLVQTVQHDLAPAVSYAEWSNGLAQPAATADPDNDGQKNLTEYAFGSDPTSGHHVVSGNVVAGTVLSVSGGTATLRFPVRTDTQVRGLSYIMEFSDTLASWSQTPPVGTLVNYAAYSPAIPGFTESVVTFPSGSGKKFVRVRMVLDESAPGMANP